MKKNVIHGGAFLERRPRVLDIIFLLQSFGGEGPHGADIGKRL